MATPPRKIALADVTGPLDAADAAGKAAARAALGMDPILAGKEPLSAYSSTSDPSTNLLATHDRARMRFTHAAPTLVIQLQTTAEYASGFTFRGISDQEITIDAVTGVTLEGVSGQNIVVPANAWFTLSRRSSNDWNLARGPVLPADVLAAWRARPATVLATDDDGDPVSHISIQPPDATIYHLVTGKLAGLAGQGDALDRFLHDAMPLTPVNGDITWLWSLDPALSAEPPEIALAQANRPSNAEVSLTSETSDAGTVRLLMPAPLDGEVRVGIERRSFGFRLVNDDPYAGISVALAAPAIGRLASQWRPPLSNFVLWPGDEAHVWGRVRGGEIDFDQIIRAAVWSSISPVGGGAVTQSGNTVNIPNILRGDAIFIASLRSPGASIVTPEDKGYVEPAGNGFDATGRLIASGRTIKIVHTFATADGTFASGTFTNASRVWGVALRGVGAIGRHIGAFATSASLAFPALPPLLAPRAHVLGFTARALDTHVMPSGATSLVGYQNAGVTSSNWWTMGEASSHAPSPLAQTSGSPPAPASVDWLSAAFEIIPRRIS